MSKPWNWCEFCEQLVDADDVHDGSEVLCHGCDRIYDVHSDAEGETWWLELQEPGVLHTHNVDDFASIDDMRTALHAIELLRLDVIRLKKRVMVLEEQRPKGER